MRRYRLWSTKRADWSLEKPLREKSAKCFISIIFDPQYNRDFTLIEKQRKRGTNRMLLRLGAYGHINTYIWTAT